MYQHAAFNNQFYTNIYLIWNWMYHTWYLLPDCIQCICVQVSTHVLGSCKQFQECNDLYGMQASWSENDKNNVYAHFFHQNSIKKALWRLMYLLKLISNPKCKTTTGKLEQFSIMIHFVMSNLVQSSFCFILL